MWHRRHGVGYRPRMTNIKVQYVFRVAIDAEPEELTAYGSSIDIIKDFGRDLLNDRMAGRSGPSSVSIGIDIGGEEIEWLGHYDRDGDGAFKWAADT